MTLTVPLNVDILAHQLDGYAASSDGYFVGLTKSYSFQLVSSGASSPIGCTVTVSSSNDGVNYAAGTPASVTTNATSFLTIPTNYARFIKVAKAISSGSVKIQVFLATQGDE